MPQHCPQCRADCEPLVAVGGGRVCPRCGAELAQATGTGEGRPTPAAKPDIVAAARVVDTGVTSISARGAPDGAAPSGPPARGALPGAGSDNASAKSAPHEGAPATAATGRKSGPAPYSTEAGDSPATSGIRSAINELPMLGPYQIIGEVGRGGMGRVFKAMHTRLRQVRALKVLGKAESRDPKLVSRFEREARSAATISHPNVVRAFECDRDAGRGLYYMAMEYVEGGSVAHVLKRRGKLPWQQAVQIGQQVAYALDALHKAGLVHRDIKPSNILLDKTGTAKLADMGLVRHEADGIDTQLTATGVLMGTIDYMAPEQIVDPRQADIRSDIYALGCSLFHMISGQPPFAEGTAFQKMQAHLQSEPPDIAPMAADVPFQLSMLLRRMMAKNPEDRFASPRELIDALRHLTQPESRGFVLGDFDLKSLAVQAQQERDGDARTVGPETERAALPWWRQRRVYAAGGPAIALVVLAIVATTWPRRSDESEPVAPPVPGVSAPDNATGTNSTAYTPPRNPEPELPPPDPHPTLKPLPAAEPAKPDRRPTFDPERTLLRSLPERVVTRCLLRQPAFDTERWTFTPPAVRLAPVSEPGLRSAIAISPAQLAGGVEFLTLHIGLSGPAAAIPIEQGQVITVQFRARASQPHVMRVAIEDDRDDHSFLATPDTIELKREWHTYRSVFRSQQSVPQARLRFLDLLAERTTIWLADVQVMATARPVKSVTSAKVDLANEPLVVGPGAGEFPDLDAALAAAVSGSVIVIRQSGVTPVPARHYPQHELAIKGAPGCWPILEPAAGTPPIKPGSKPLAVFASDGPFDLTLESLHLLLRGNVGSRTLFHAATGRLALAQCTATVPAAAPDDNTRWTIARAGFDRDDSLRVEVQQSLFRGAALGPLVSAPAGGSADVRFDGSLWAAGGGPFVERAGGAGAISCQIAASTLYGIDRLALFAEADTDRDKLDRIKVTTSDTLFFGADRDRSVLLEWKSASTKPETMQKLAADGRISWLGRGSVFFGFAGMWNTGHGIGQFDRHWKQTWKANSQNEQEEDPWLESRPSGLELDALVPTDLVPLPRRPRGERLPVGVPVAGLPMPPARLVAPVTPTASADAPPAKPREWRVQKNGEFKTIEAAVEAAASGDTILIADSGPYDPILRDPRADAAYLTIRKDLTIRAAPGIAPGTAPRINFRAPRPLPVDAALRPFDLFHIAGASLRLVGLHLVVHGDTAWSPRLISATGCPTFAMRDCSVSIVGRRESFELARTSDTAGIWTFENSFLQGPIFCSTVTQVTVRNSVVYSPAGPWLIGLRGRGVLDQNTIWCAGIGELPRSLLLRDNLIGLARDSAMFETNDLKPDIQAARNVYFEWNPPPPPAPSKTALVRLGRAELVQTLAQWQDFAGAGRVVDDQLAGTLQFEPAKPNDMRRFSVKSYTPRGKTTSIERSGVGVRIDRVARPAEWPTELRSGS